MKARTSLLSTAGLALAGVLASRLLRTRYVFTERVVAITGGSRGLGLAMARVFGAKGAKLALLARDRAELERARADLARRGVSQVLTIPCDVRDETMVQSAMAEIASHYGRLDVLVNNAGMITVGPLDTMTKDDFEDSMNLHFRAPLYTMMAARLFLRQAPGGGRIVNISSFGGKIAVPHLAPYCASKFALTGLSDAFRAELAGDGIRVTTVCPGLLRTGSHVNAFFKGNHEAEFAWFASGMGTPGSAMGAERAARQIVEACRSGRAELILTLRAKAAVLAQTLAPGVMAGVLRTVNSVLPASNRNQKRYTGWQSRGLAPAPLVRKADEATGEFNGLRGRAAV